MSGTLRFGIGCLAISFSFLCCMGDARAVDFINTLNLNGTFTSGGNNTPTAGDMMAQSFTTTASDYIVREIDLTLFRGSGESGAYSVYIYSSTGSGDTLVPDTLAVTIFAGQSFSSGTYPIPETSTLNGSDVAPIEIKGLNIILNPSTAYFVVAGFDTGSFGLNWAANDWTATSPNPSTFIGDPSYFALYDSSTSSWNNLGRDQPSAVRVVPEPSTWAFGMLAAAVIAATSRRRRQA